MALKTITTNQLVLLFDIHRGYDPKIHPGTLDTDLKVLLDNKLIEPGSLTDFKYKLTSRGESCMITVKAGVCKLVEIQQRNDK